MSELLEIILQAVDNASDIIEGIGDTARGTADEMESAFDGATFDQMAASLEEANSEVERLENELAAIYMGDIEGDAEAVEAALAEAQEEAKKLADALQEAEEKGDGLEEAVNGIESLMAFEAISDVVNQLIDGMWQVADMAGTVQDSWQRLGLAAEGAGIDVDGMKESVNSLSDETGRAGGDIREAFISMSGAGIESLGTMETLFKGAAAQAYIHGTSVDALANKYTGMAMRSKVAEKTLKDTGITVGDLGEAMGMQGATIDEINDKWETLTTDQRANILGTAALMGEGQDANAAFKHSWEGLQVQVDKAKDKLMVLAGKVLLPVLVPAMEVAGRILDWLGDTIEGVMDGPFGTLISVVGSAGGALVILLAGITAITTAMPFLTATLWPAVTASWALLAPWLPFIAIGAAAVAVIYEVGKAFGWWDDVGGMIDAVWDGIQKLWDAFINHPDVQALIQGLTDAWNWLVPAVMGVIGAIAEFFGINESGSFDVVADMIKNIGMAWQVITMPIRTVIWIIQQVISVFDQFRTGQMDLPGFIMTVLGAIGTLYAEAWNTIITLVIQFGSQMVQRAVSAASRFVSGIMGKVRSLPGKVYSALSSVLSSIRGAIQGWINAASKKVSDLISKIVTPLKNLPGKITDALGGVASALARPFQDAWDNTIGPIVDKIGQGIKDIQNFLGGSYGGEGAYGGETIDTISGNNFNIQTGEFTTDNSPIEINQNVTLDLRNVPANIDTPTLIAMLQDKEVLQALTSNADFQNLDARVKQKLNLKGVRARGR